jgi:hypothetical protein
MNMSLYTQSQQQINPIEATNKLEAGSVLYFPDYYYIYSDPDLMTDKILDGKHKNISYDYQRHKLGGYRKDVQGLEDKLKQFMHGYAEFSKYLIQKTLPAYIPYLQWGRTSFRPAQISGRSLSKRKDDTRLHVDSFPATPVNGLRILRVFCNINPELEPRVWHIGQPFTEVVDRFLPQVPTYSKFKAKLLHLVKATKTLRSPYDHYMLQIHDTMKLDDQYQKEVDKTKVEFPAQSTWIVFTDHVSHAALSGQYLLEQTFYLPVDKMVQPEQSPWHHLAQKRPELRPNS